MLVGWSFANILTTCENNECMFSFKAGLCPVATKTDKGLWREKKTALSQ